MKALFIAQVWTQRKEQHQQKFSGAHSNTQRANHIISISLSLHLDHHQSFSLTQLACTPPLHCSPLRPAVLWPALSEKTTRMWSGNADRTAAMAKMKTRLSCRSWWALSIGCPNNWAAIQTGSFMVRASEFGHHTDMCAETHNENNRHRRTQAQVWHRCFCSGSTFAIFCSKNGVIHIPCSASSVTE